MRLHNRSFFVLPAAAISCPRGFAFLDDVYQTKQKNRNGKLISAGVICPSKLRLSRGVFLDSIMVEIVRENDRNRPLVICKLYVMHAFVRIYERTLISSQNYISALCWSVKITEVALYIREAFCAFVIAFLICIKKVFATVYYTSHVFFLIASACFMQVPCIMFVNKLPRRETGHRT